MLLEASIVRLIFPMVSLLPREKTNLNKKAFWQSVLVLLVKCLLGEKQQRGELGTGLVTVST